MQNESNVVTRTCRCGKEIFAHAISDKSGEHFVFIMHCDRCGDQGEAFLTKAECLEAWNLNHLELPENTPVDPTDPENTRTEQPPLPMTDEVLERTRDGNGGGVTDGGGGNGEEVGHAQGS